MTRLAKDWPRYARALDWHLAGIDGVEIGRRLGVSRERARQIIEDAKQQLAYRVFHVSRPHRERREKMERGLQLTLIVLDAVEDALAALASTKDIRS